MERIMRTLVLTAVCVAGIAFGVSIPRVHADYTSGTVTTNPTMTINAAVIAASGTFTQGVTAAAPITRPFTALPSTIAQSVAVQGTGTSPNYKVEMLVTLDGTNYVKPEVGGALGTFTDQNWHIIPLGVPLSVGHELKITELGGANTITITAWEASQ